MDNRSIKAIWRKHGGSQHGPIVEHYTIEEQAFYRFAQALLTDAMAADKAEIVSLQAQVEVLEKTSDDLHKALWERDAQLAQERAKVRYQRAQGSTRAELRESLTRAMIDTGDCILVWANEGDLYERGDHVS